MLAVPLIRVLATHTRQIWAGALGAPLKRVIVHAFGRQAVVAIPFDFVAQGPNHLAVAAIRNLHARKYRGPPVPAGYKGACP